MINSNFREYQYFKLQETQLGQQVLPKDAQPIGAVKLAVYLTSQSIQDNINYKNAQYMALTHSSLLDSSNIIQYGDKKLKVLYINPYGRMKQVFLSEYCA